MILQDIRYALRQLRKSPGFTLTAVLTLGLGIGALTTAATWTNAVLFDPWPQVVDIRSLRFIDATVLGNQGYSVHYDQLQYLRHQGRSFSDASAFTFDQLNLNFANTQPQAIDAGVVSPTVVGLYAFLAFRVTQRRREIGIRMALGATREATVRLVLRDSARMAAIGLVIGAVLALGAARLEAAVLFGVGPFDAPSLAAALGILLLAAAGAAWVPARRAATIDPMQALRTE